MENTTVNIQTLLQWCHQTLQPELFSDYAPNGLQVEGKQHVHKIVAAVTASAAAVEAAITNEADVLLFHHEKKKKNEPVTITGWKKRRIENLLVHGINLVAYHLPLDAHPELGNNAQLAKMMNWQMTVPNTPKNFLTQGHLPQPQTLAQLGQALAEKLGRTPLLIGDPDQIIKTLGWCSGGGQGLFNEAVDAGVDCFISGEVSEAQYHLVNETGVAFISAGHHCTEKPGIQALADKLSQTFNIPWQFFDEPNPV